MSRVAALPASSPPPSILWRRAERLALDDAAEALKALARAQRRLQVVAAHASLPAGVRDACRRAAEAGGVDAGAAGALLTRTRRSGR